MTKCTSELQVCESVLRPKTVLSTISRAALCYIANTPRGPHFKCVFPH